MKITVIANAKGGCGKTTTAVTLATGLAGMNRKVLLMDLDSQPGSATKFLGLDRVPGLYRLLVSQLPLKDCLTSVEQYPLLRVVASNEETLEVNTILASRGLRPASPVTPTESLRQALAPLEKDNSVHVILDTAPSVSHLQVAALGIADYLLVPTTPEYASEIGVGQIAELVGELRKHGGSLRLIGVLPTMIDRRTNEHKRTMDELEEVFGDLLYPEIGRTIKLGETPRYGIPIWDHAPDSQGARDCARVLKRFLEDVG